MPIRFVPGIRKEIWDETIVKQKLEDLAASKKETQWIHSDLSVTDSSRIGRCLWKLVCKYFQCLRNCFYNINNDASSKILERMWRKVDVCEDPELVKLFYNAVINFSSITKRNPDLPMVEIFKRIVAHDNAKEFHESKLPPGLTPADVKVSVEPPAPQPEPVSAGPNLPRVDSAPRYMDSSAEVNVGTQPIIINEYIPVPEPVYISTPAPILVAAPPVCVPVPAPIPMYRAPAAPVLVGNPGVSRTVRNLAVPAPRMPSPVAPVAPVLVGNTGVSAFSRPRENRSYERRNAVSYESKRGPAPTAFAASHASRGVHSRGNVIPGRR